MILFLERGDGMQKSTYRIETELEVKTYLDRLHHALDNGAVINIQIERKVDEKRDIKYTNKYTLANLFPDENPKDALRRELRTLTVNDYLRTVKDTRFPNRSEMREFGKVYNKTDEIYIKIRVELLDPANFGRETAFVMSFHYAETSFEEEDFPYKK